MHESDLEVLVKHDHFTNEYYRYKRDPSQGGVAILAMIFFFVAIIIWGIIVLSRPNFCCIGSNIDSGRSFGAALILAFVIVLVIAVIWIIIAYVKKTK